MKNKKGYIQPIAILIVIILIIYGINYYLDMQKTVTIQNNQFNKKDIIISKGDFVIFKNMDSYKNEVLVDGKIFDIRKNGEMKISFKDRGIYEFHLKSDYKANGTVTVN